ncbi:MAG: SigE family RNA polymerase sigma factor [Nocardioidaceae bacterium]
MGEMREQRADPAAGPSDSAAPSARLTPSFEQFVVSRSSSLWRSAWLLTGDAHKAEDLLQIALLKAWRRWDKIARDGAVEGYVRRCLVTTYTDWWRRAWTGELPSDVLPERAATADADLVELRQDVLAALATLTRGQRAVVVLRYFDDLTEVQTADALGVSVGTVKSQTARALNSLRSSPLLMPSDEETP